MIRKRKLTDAERQEIADAQAWLRDEASDINTELARARVSVSDGYTVDSVPAALMERALEYAVQQGIMEATTKTVWREVFPIDRDMPKGARTKIYTIWSGSAMSAWYRYDGKHPNVSVGAKQVSISFKPRSQSYTLDALEMMAADYAGVSVEAMKVAKIFEGFDEDIEDLMFVGSTEDGFYGLVDHPNITQGALTTGNWDAAATTGTEIVEDVKAIITAMVVANKGSRKFRGLTIDVMCSPELYRIGTTKIANTETNETVEQVLQKTDPRFGRFIESPMHEETEGGAGDYVHFGPFSNKASICVPMSMDAERQRPDDRGMVIEQPFVTMFAGLHVKEPLHFYQGEGAHS